MRFLSPWALVFLGWAGGMLWLALRSRRTVAGRTLTLLFVVLALSQPEVSVPQRDEAVFLLVDRSASVGTAAHGPSERLADQLRSRGAQVGVVEFAETARLVQPPTIAPLPASDPVWAKLGTGSDIGAAIHLALALAPQAATQLVLISDGRADRGDALAAAHRARTAGIPVSVYPVGQYDLVRVANLSGPRTVPLGAVELHGHVAASRLVEAEIRWRRDGAIVARTQEVLEPGLTAVSLRDSPDGEGLHRYRLEVDAPGDHVRENNALDWAVHVGEVPQVLVVGARESAVDELLSGAGLTYRRVEALSPYLLQGAGLVILDDHPLGMVGAAAANSLRTHAASGGGMLVIQGSQAVEGITGRLEDLLPVSYSVPGRLHEATAALIFVLDRSLSMGAQTMGMAHIDLLKQATAAAVEAMPAEDIVGVLAFDRQVHWLAQPSRVEDAENELFRALRGLTPGGGTDIYPGMIEALDALEEIDARLRHVVVLSDGKTLPRREYPDLRERIAESGVGVTAIAVGGGADLEVLGKLAQAGQGELIVTRDFRELQQIFIGETTRVTRPRFMEGDVLPLPGPAATAWGLADSGLPPLTGYALTFPKPAAEVGLITPAGDPLFAAWRYGLGRVAVFNADLSGGWSEAWCHSDVLGRVWGHWLGRLWPSRSPVHVSWEGEGAKLLITADVEDGGRWVNGLSMAGRLVGPAATEELTFTQTAPGRYEASVRHPGAGAYLIAVWDESGTYAVTTGLSLPYSESLHAFGPDLERLEPLHALTGGAFLGDELPPPSSHAGRRWIPLWKPFLWAGGAAFLGDLLLRKLWPSSTRSRVQT